MGRDKATVRFRGPAGEITFVEQVVNTLRARCPQVFVIAARGQALPDLDAEVLRDNALFVSGLLAWAVAERRGWRGLAAGALAAAAVLGWGAWRAAALDDADRVARGD